MMVTARFGAQFHAKAEYFPISPSAPRAKKLGEIIPVVSAVTGIRENEIRSDRRRHDIARARQITCFVAREMTSLSFATIGRLMRRDHSTVQKGCEKIEELRKHDPLLDECIKIIMARLA